MGNNIKLTFSQVKYIIYLYRLARNEHGVKNVELANALRFSKPSVHNMLRSLAELGVIKQETFGLAFFTEEGCALAQKYTSCYTVLKKNMAEICGNGAISENALCGLLSDMPTDKLEALYKKSKGN